MHRGLPELAGRVHLDVRRVGRDRRPLEGEGLGVAHLLLVVDGWMLIHCRLLTLVLDIITMLHRSIYKSIIVTSPPMPLF